MISMHFDWKNCNCARNWKFGNESEVEFASNVTWTYLNVSAPVSPNFHYARPPTNSSSKGVGTQNSLRILRPLFQYLFSTSFQRTILSWLITIMNCSVTTNSNFKLCSNDVVKYTHFIFTNTRHTVLFTDFSTELCIFCANDIYNNNNNK